MNHSFIENNREIMVKGRGGVVLRETIIIIMNSIYIALFHSGTECSKRFTIQILPPTDLVSI